MLSIPFIGIFALHRHLEKSSITRYMLLLSIPFIGIFALHLRNRLGQLRGNGKNFQFPLLGFLLCISMLRVNAFTINAMTFNSLYWDFCSASMSNAIAVMLAHDGFQFPLLGFLLCIYAYGN